MRQGSLGQRLGLVALLAATAIVMTVAATALAGGPYTIRGHLLSFDGKPIAGYPVVLTALAPGGKGLDNGNTVWQVPNYDSHATVTDGNGAFTMTDVIDYPQVTHHQYRVWGGNDGQSADAPRLQYPFLRFAYMLDLSQATSSEVYIVVKGEPATAFKVIAKDRNGRPYTGTASIGLASGGHSYNWTAQFKDGVYVRVAVPVGNQKEMGRVVILADKTAEESKKKAEARGEKVVGMGLIAYEPVLDRRVAFMPFQFSTIEVDLPFVSE